MPVKTQKNRVDEGVDIGESERLVHKHYLGHRVCAISLCPTPDEDDDYDGDGLGCEFCSATFGYPDVEYSEVDYYEDPETGQYICTDCGWGHEMEHVMKGHQTKEHEEDEENGN